MEKASIYQSLRLRWRDGAWLAIALILHGSLFFIPLNRFHAGQNESPVLSLSLTIPLAPKPATVEAPEPVPSPDPVTPEVVKPEDIETEIPEERIADFPPPQAPQTDPDDPPPPVTTAQLVDSASRIKWSIPKAEEHRKLGEHQVQEIPQNWRPSIRLDDNLFDGMTVPEKTEVVDQWLAADGSHNVVINTPSGETLCGRKRAWDPMNPMVEHLTMFSPCGGGGKRTFKMPARFSRHLVD